MTPPHEKVSYVADCLSRKVIFFTGKGGVGKSTLAWATAKACARRGARVSVASWNPFEDPAWPAEAEASGVRWLPLETQACFREYALRILKFDKVYDAVFDNKVLRTFIKAAPGLPETVVAGKIWDLVDRKEQDLLLVDLPSSGHAVSFFQSPLGIRKIFPVGFVNRESKKLIGMFEDRVARIDLVALPEELPVVECLQLKEKLEGMLGFHFGFLHLNQCTPRFTVTKADILPAMPKEARDTAERHLERVAGEEEAISLAWNLRLPTRQIPLQPAERINDTVDRVAAFLET